MTRVFGLPRAAVLALAFAVGGLFIISTPAHAGTTVCTATVGSTILADFSQNISADPDSSVPGPTWALDTFTRHVQIWQETDDSNVVHYCAKATDSGTFATLGGTATSPQNGAALPVVVNGTMSGGTFGEITGGTFDSTGGSIQSAIDCAGADSATCSSGLTSY